MRLDIGRADSGGDRDDQGRFGDRNADAGQRDGHLLGLDAEQEGAGLARGLDVVGDGADAKLLLEDRAALGDDVRGDDLVGAEDIIAGDPPHDGLGHVPGADDGELVGHWFGVYPMG